jgi:hypothetical protein
LAAAYKRKAGYPLRTAAYLLLPSGVRPCCDDLSVLQCVHSLLIAPSVLRRLWSSAECREPPRSRLPPLLDGERIFVRLRISGRDKTSGLDMNASAANVFTLRSGKVKRLVIYWDSERPRPRAGHRTPAPSPPSAAAGSPPEGAWDGPRAFTAQAISCAANREALARCVPASQTSPTDSMRRGESHNGTALRCLRATQIDAGYSPGSFSLYNSRSACHGSTS